MNNKNIILALFAIVAAVQIYMPLSMIFANEDVLKNGTEFKFRTLPIDPYDPFIGRYITLRYGISSYEMENDFSSGQTVYVYLKTDYEGYAYIADIRTANLDSSLDGDYVKATVSYASETSVNINFPFNRYYMREDIAKTAERVHDRLSSGNEDHVTYALINVKKGEGVIEGVYIDGILIEDYVDLLESGGITEETDAETVVFEGVE